LLNANEFDASRTPRVFGIHSCAELFVREHVDVAMHFGVQSFVAAAALEQIS
jgi:hypothetical protein